MLLRPGRTKAARRMRSHSLATVGVCSLRKRTTMQSPFLICRQTVRANSPAVFRWNGIRPRWLLPTNHHAPAERFGVLDRFVVNAEVSPDGHNWSTAAYATDYLEKTIPSNYSSRGRTYDYEGTNRGKIPDDDVAEPSSGYLWNL